MTDVDPTDSAYYLNRELSELAFQARVLAEGMDERNPPLERLRFLAFFTKNTDEFFMKRVGGLKQQIDAGVTETTPDGRTPEAQWREVLDAARPLFRDQSRYWEETLAPALADAGIAVCDPASLSSAEQTALQTYFEESILPTLTPLAFDPAHPFPFISNLSLSLAVRSADESGDETFTRIKVPPNRPRLVPVPDADGQYVLIEDLIEANLDLLVPDLEILDVSKFKVTRNAEVRRNEEVAEDLIEVVEEVIEQRRFATVVRLEVGADMPEASVETLKTQLDVTDREVFRRKGPLDFEDFFELTELDRPALSFPAWSPQSHPRFRPVNSETGEGSHDIFDEIRAGDVLTHHPYHSFEGTVQQFLDAAATDPDVLAVKAAIYRTASDSKVIQSLIDAADNGKQVAVMVELKARFDEENNLEWVRQLEEEGIHVAYGTVGLKTHTKTALVVRQEDDGVRLYSHVGTGNYHSETAKGYVDLGLLTADRDVGQDLTKVFNFFTGPTLDDRFRRLLIAPVTMRERFTEMVRREAAHARAGERARIVVKVNGLEDPEMVEALYRASMAGVEIDLIVRDICRLRPGIEGLSETITVHAIVGRFLEHSRIFYFENAGDPEWYIGSADWMTRNLDYRVEAVTPVTDRSLRRQLRFILETSLMDNRRRWVMDSDGEYTQVTPGDDPVCDSQSVFMEATSAAVDRGYGPGMAVDAAPTAGELLVEPLADDDDDSADDDDGAGDDDSADDDDGASDDDSADDDDGASDDDSADDDDGASDDDSVDGDDDSTDDDNSSAGGEDNSSAGGEDNSSAGGDDGSAEDVSAGDADYTTAGRNADNGHETDSAPVINSDTASATTGVESVFDAYADRWYQPDSETYAWAVRTTDGDRRYFTTREGARERLRAEYGDES